ncbi:MBL fold metallo-hydrolase [Pseudothauera lacus]|uniref:MBL fold metallo-hydrolase n=1 Tax=Pseudothauera lacus TaxID=2136175 RepID=A0A2T4IFY0_9RHOO|nr:MBL fold metallo-hydrolase [Pseudothauera lacus]PTD96606.1 MBL fold metallo-hydrolase [Pseudothauera lacus]
MPTSSARLDRRRFLQFGVAAAGASATAALWPAVSAFADDLDDFIKGPPVPDIAPRQLSEHVWMIYAEDGFPTPENQGMMCNVTFAITRKGVVMLDPGGSVQIGEMVIRQIRRLTERPVVAVFNSHYHGDHWLANHAFAEAYGTELPIYAHPHTRTEILGVQGNLWRSLLERWTNQATAGTRIVAPTHEVAHGAEFDFGDLTLRVHHYGTAHTPGDICLEAVEDRLTYAGDVAMDRRIANMDDGSYPGTFRYYDALEANAASRIWVPGHGHAGAGVLDWNRSLFEGIWERCVEAVENGDSMEAARAAVLADPRVAGKAAETLGFEANIGKYISLAYLEAEKEAF